MSLIKIGNTDLENIAGYGVEFYDLSDNSNRNAKGNMRLNIVNSKYKLLIKTTYLTQNQLQTFFSKIPVGTLSVTYYNPYTGTNRTANMYRGDRKVSMKWNTTTRGKVYEPVEISLVEL